MSRLPECLVVIDPRKEKNAVREARKLGITTVALIDTDCDPDEIDLPIPGNDDSIRSIELLVQLLAQAVTAGKGASAEGKQEQAEGACRPPLPPGRKSRVGRAQASPTTSILGGARCGSTHPTVFSPRPGRIPKPGRRTGTVPG